MELGLKDKTALITGGSKGIGRAIAEEFAREGCNIVLVARTAADLEATRSALSQNTDVRINIFSADLSEKGGIDRLIDMYPNVDILINNAGAIPAGSLLVISDEQWRAGWELKVFGFINMCRAYYAKMKARRAGVIVNVIGAAVETLDPSYICGVTGNAALSAFTRSLGSESVRNGVRVVGVSPGPVSTERLLNFVRTKTADTSESNLPFKHLPFGRPAAPAEIAAATAFLASERSGYSSGCILIIDGGMHRLLAP